MDNELQIEKQMKEQFAPFLEKGFSYRYFYEKGGDSSCVYIYRFQKGKDFFDLREVSGGDELNFVVYAGGAYQFPSLKSLYKKEFQAFFWKHFFKKPSKEERRAFLGELLVRSLDGATEFFGIKL
ncbi:MAG: hypothetical protein IJX98_03795 [Clostridia bacterium]|nr:hypothetical protein [Clostridia bacterium]